MSRAQRLLPRFALLTVALLYLVVIAGAVVRATGSGMGCPDWPKCYGQLIPPVSVEDVDFSKLEIERFREAWQRRGHDPVEVTEATLRRDFNARATWTEFINRCIGALSGLAALGTLICAIICRRRDWKLIGVLVCQGGLFGVVAWLGKVVVDTNLLPWKITLHMMLAVLLVTSALLALHLVRPGPAVLMTKSLRRHLLAAALLTVAQIVIGTQVRELADHLAAGECCDGRLESRLGMPLVWHRIGAVAVLTVVAIAFFRLKFSTAGAPVISTLLGLLVCLEYGVGVLLIRAGLPAFLQPVHLVLAVILHGFLFVLLLRSRLQTGPAAATLTAS